MEVLLRSRNAGQLETVETSLLGSPPARACSCAMTNRDKSWSLPTSAFQTYHTVYDSR